MSEKDSFEDMSKRRKSLDRHSSNKLSLLDEADVTAQPNEDSQPVVGNANKPFGSFMSSLFKGPASEKASPAAGGSALSWLGIRSEKINPANLTLENLNKITSPAEAVAALKNSLDVKSDEYFHMALDLITHLCETDPTKQMAVDLGDKGACGHIDQILGLKILSSQACECALRAMCSLVTTPAERSEGRRHSDTGLSPEAAAAVVAGISNNRKKLSSSSAIYRIIKGGYTHMPDAIVLEWGLRVISYLALEEGMVPKLMACGGCELLTQSLASHRGKDDIVQWVSKCVYNFIICDVETAAQEKFSDNGMCEALAGGVLGESCDTLSELAVVWVLKAVGALARYHTNNKRRLGLANICSLLNRLYGRFGLANKHFSESICWAIGNVAFPDEQNQDALGAENACEIVIKSLRTHVNAVLVVQEALRAVRSLCHNHTSNLDALHAAGIVQTVMAVLRQYRETHSDVMQWVWYVVATLANHEPCLQELGRDGISSAVVASLNRFSESEDLVQWAALAMARIADSPDLSAQLNLSQCCPAIAQALHNHLGNADVAEEVMNAIGVLSSLPANRIHFAKVTICETVVAALVKHEKADSVVEAGLFATMNLIQIAEPAAAATAEGDSSSSVKSPSSPDDSQSLLPRRGDSNTPLDQAADRLTNCFIAAQAWRVVPRVLSRHAESEYVAEYGCRVVCDLVSVASGEGENGTSLLLPSTAALSHTHRQNSNLNGDTVVKLGSGGAAASLCTVLQNHMSSAYVVKFALLGLDRLCYADKNIPLLRSGGACSLVIRAIHTHYLIAEVVQLGCSLIAHLCYEQHSRERIQNEGGLEVVLAALAQHVQSPAVAQVGCDAIAGLCVPPTQDAIAFVISKENQNAVHATKEKAIASIDWINFDVNNTEHLNILAASNASVTQERTAAAAVPQKESFFHWGSVKEEGGGGLSGLDALAGAASNFISTGTSDLEAELIAAKRAAAMDQRKFTDRLLQTGMHSSLASVMQTHWNNETVLISAVNALNGLAMYPANRVLMSKDGLLELVAGVLMRCLNFAEKSTPKSNVPFSEEASPPTNLNENGGRRILTIMLNVLIGSCCLPESNNDRRPAPSAKNIGDTWATQEFLGGLNACECLVMCGESHEADPLMTEVTLRGLYYLVLGHEGNQSRVGATDFSPLVVRILKNQLDKPKLVYYSCLCISALAQDNRPNSLLLGQENVCEAVVRALDKYMTNEDVAEACCHAIFGLKALNSVLGIVNACEYVIQAFVQHPANATVAQWGCRAIGTLAELESNRVELDKHNVCKVVTAALQKHVSSDSLLSAFMKDTSSAGVAKWGCTAIYYLAKGSDVYQQKLVAAGACEAVARALVKFSEIESVSYCCCRTLVVLLMNNEAYKAKLGNLGVVGCIVESMHIYPSSVQIAKWGCRALAVLAESNEANISRIGMAGGCETIPVIIQAHQVSEHVAGAGCDVISFMAETLSNGYAARLGHAGGCEAVISVLRKHSDNASVASRASIALASLARERGNSSWLGPAGACDALVTALQTHSADITVCKFAISAMGNLCVVENNKERLGSMGACELVAAAMTTHIEDLETVKAAGLTIGKLCEVILRNDPVSEEPALPATSPITTVSPTPAAAATTAPTPAPAASLSRRRSISTLPSSLQMSDDRSALSELTVTSLHFVNKRFNRGSLFECGVCEIIVNGLNRHLTNAAAANILCRTVSILSFGEACNKEREVLGGLGACKAVTNAIQFHEGVEEVARSGCLAVKALAYHNAANQALLLDSGVAATLIGILRGYRYANSGPATVEAAAWAISSFAMDFPRAKAALGAAGACEGLLEVVELHSRNLETTYLTVKALFHVCDGNTANRLKISFSGAADILVSVLSKHPDDERVVEYVYSTMIGMCLDKVGQSRLGTVNMPKQVVASLYKYEKTSEYLVLLCCTLTGLLASNSKINQDKLGNAGACKAIVAMMQKFMSSNSSASTLESVESRLTLASVEEEVAITEGAEDAAAAPSAAALDESKTALSSLIDEFSVLKEGCKAIVQLVNNNDTNRHKFLATNVMDILTSILSSSFASFNVGLHISIGSSASGSSKPPSLASSQPAGLQASEDTKEWARIAMDALLGKT